MRVLRIWSTDRVNIGAVQVQASDNHQPLSQPKRILGIIAKLPCGQRRKDTAAPTPKEAFKVATQNNFDYSAFLFGGVNTLIAEGTNAHRHLRKGVGGFGRYYWRGFASRTDGNYLVLFVLPTVFHQDERYYAKGEGRVWKRAIYSASRVLITPDYHGRNSFNASEIVGRGIAQTVSLTYYPSADRTAGALAVRYGWGLGRDAITNVFREFGQQHRAMDLCHQYRVEWTAIMFGSPLWKPPMHHLPRKILFPSRTGPPVSQRMHAAMFSAPTHWLWCGSGCVQRATKES